MSINELKHQLSTVLILKLCQIERGIDNIELKTALQDNLGYPVDEGLLFVKWQR